MHEVCAVVSYYKMSNFRSSLFLPFRLSVCLILFVSVGLSLRPSVSAFVSVHPSVYPCVCPIRPHSLRRITELLCRVQGERQLLCTESGAHWPQTSVFRALLTCKLRVGSICWRGVLNVSFHTYCNWTLAMDTLLLLLWPNRCNVCQCWPFK